MNPLSKYRIWGKKEKRFIDFIREDSVNYWFHILNDGSLWAKSRYNYITNFNKEDYIVQHFTGFVDQNNKEIFEGDILDYGDGDIFPVYFKDGCFWTNNMWLYEDLVRENIIGAEIIGHINNNI